jgi:hypothetical protein
MAKNMASPTTRRVLQHIVDLYNSWGKPEKAREYAAIPGQPVGRK